MEKEILQHLSFETYYKIKHKHENYYCQQYQILTLLKKGRIMDYGNLITLLLYFINNPQNREIVVDLLKILEQKNLADSWFYENIKKLIISGSSQQAKKRDDTHSEQHGFYIKKLAQSGNTKYLDIGCGDGTQTLTLGNLLGYDKNNINGSDILDWDDNFTRNKDLNFSPIIKGKLQYQNKSFSLITVFSVLHHVNELNNLISEINRCLSDDGLLVIREHNAFDDSDKLLIDIEHMLYSIVNNSKSLGYIKCYSKIEWIEILKKNGFYPVLIENLVRIPRGDYKITKPFIAIFKKTLSEL
jgi:ubiquinone/menaquinone biosynthesis C-methylase UbiE